MKKAYEGDKLTIQAEAGERVRYRIQRMDQPRDMTNPYTELQEKESFTIRLNEEQLQCLEVETADGKYRYFPPRENTCWKVFIKREKFIKEGNTKLRVLGQWGAADKTAEIHLSHIYMNVDGKKVYLSSTEKALGRDEWQWRIHSAESLSFQPEKYCKEFVEVRFVWD